MNKKELAREVAEKIDLPVCKVDKILTVIMDSIAEAVGSGHEVKLVGFGTFDTISRSERIARNPQTGESVEVPAKIVPRFRAGSIFREVTNQE